MTDLPTRNHWNPCHVSWQEVSGLHRFGKKSPASCQGGGSKRRKSAVSYGFACHEKCMASILRNHTKWGTWRFEITMTWGHVGHLEVWNHRHDIWARDWFWSNYRHHPRTFICKKDGPNGGWKTGACVEEALSVKGYVGYVVNQYFAIFLGASFNKLMRIQAMFPPQTSLQ